MFPLNAIHCFQRHGDVGSGQCVMVSRRMQALVAVFSSLALGISASAAALGDADPEADGEPPPLISSRDLTAILGNSPVLSWRSLRPAIPPQSNLNSMKFYQTLKFEQGLSPSNIHESSSSDYVLTVKEGCQQTIE